MNEDRHAGDGSKDGKERKKRESQGVGGDAIDKYGRGRDFYSPTGTFQDKQAGKEHGLGTQQFEWAHSRSKFCFAKDLAWETINI